MYADIRNHIYDKLMSVKNNNPVILWSGGPYSTLAWWVAKKDLNLDYPIIFVDTGDLPPNLYSHIARMKQNFGLKLEIAQGKVSDIIAQKKYGVYLSGHPIEGATAIIPEGQDTWNFLKSLPLQFFGGSKRLIK